MKEKMNERRKVIGIAMAAMIVVSILAVIAPQAFGYFRPVPIPPGEEGIYYLSPPNITVSSKGECMVVQLHINTSGKIAGGAFNLTYDPTCAEISCANWTRNTTLWPMGTCSQPAYGSFYITYYAPTGVEYPPGDYHIGNLIICCNSTAGCCNFDFGYFTDETYYTNSTWEYYYIPLETSNFTCGAPTEETYSKDLYEGWNLVSLPLTPSDNSTSSVLASVWDNVSAVYRYNATSKQFERASTMDPGEGYFVYVTQNCTWTYSGTSYTSMSIELKKGLNMVGWLNCSEDISDALSSIAGDYWYVARWNAIERKFEVYNPVAPPVFNDFTTMERGEGYFISMKRDGTLTESC